MTGSTSQAPEPLRRLARRHGVATSYDDVDGIERHPRAEILVAVLRALGVPVEHPDDAVALLDDESRSERRGPPSVVVTAVDRPRTVPAGPARGRWTLRAVDPGVVGGGAAIVAAGDVDDGRIALPALPVGAYELLVDAHHDRTTSRVLAAPGRIFHDPDLRRGWGVFAPLHAVRHPDRAGDLGDVRRLARLVRPHGGRFVATLPLLATFLGDDPFEPSPYAPVSRRYFDEIWIDPARTPVGPVDAPAAPPTVDDLVDHHALHGRARAIVSSVRRSLSGDSAAARDLAAFRSARPEVEAYAAFRAAVERHGPRPPHLDGDRDDVEHHVVAQWVLDRQLSELRRDLDQQGQGLSLDLPVGSHPDGFDVHSRPELYAPATVGAPPDTFFSAGQDWGFPPMHPGRMREEGHDTLLADLDALARGCRLLRIDHVMGLRRLWWIPSGARADEGTYVEYPLDELLAVVAIVSHRRRTTMYGENLGTVPAEVDGALDRVGMAGMHVEQFVVADPPQGSLPSVPAGSIAGLNTHDTPTFAGFWAGRDLEDTVDLGLRSPQDLPAAVRDRADAVDRYRSLVADELDRPVEAERPAVQRAALERLARSDAEHVVVDLGDLWGETEPHNVPGTHRERPNWRRRMARPLEETFDSADASAAIDLLATTRPAPQTTRGSRP